MRILVFGGTGFLGSSFVPKLIERGHQVTVITRHVDSLLRLQAMGATGMTGDLLALDSFSKRIRDVDAMVLIAQPTFFGQRVSRRRLALLKNEVTLMHTHALQLAQEHACPIVITSGTAFRTQGDEVADESWPLARTGIARMGEGVDELIEQARSRGEPKYVRILPGEIYGPGGMFQKMIEWAKQGRNAIIGDGQNCIPRIHVDDCAEAYIRVIERLPTLASGESFIVADDVPCTMAEVAAELASLLGLPPPKRIPAVGQLVIRLVMGNLVLETMQMHCRVTNAKAKRALGWTPKYPSFREGLPATVAALRARGV